MEALNKAAKGRKEMQLRSFYFLFNLATQLLFNVQSFIGDLFINLILIFQNNVVEFSP